MKMIIKYFSAIAFSLLLFAGCSGGAPESEQPEEELVIPGANPLRGNAAAIAEGKNIFKVKCSQCHGPDAVGGPEAPDLTDEETRYGSADDDVFRIVWYGTPSNMPTWKKDLGKDNIWKVLAYVESLKK